MRRYCVIVALVGALCVTGASVASAQDGFVVGHADVGPTIGLGGIGGADFAFGGRFEQGVKALPNLGNGVLGIGVSIDWYHYDDPLFGNFSFTYVPIAVTGNYHFSLQNKKVDPFVGAGLGYERVSFDCGAFDCGGASSSGIYFVGHAGIRYFFTPSTAFYVDAGAGAASLNVGLMFKIK